MNAHKNSQALNLMTLANIPKRKGNCVSKLTTIKKCKNGATCKLLLVLRSITFSYNFPLFCAYALAGSTHVVVKDFNFFDIHTYVHNSNHG